VKRPWTLPWRTSCVRNGDVSAVTAFLIAHLFINSFVSLCHGSPGVLSGTRAVRRRSLQPRRLCTRRPQSPQRPIQMWKRRAGATPPADLVGTGSRRALRRPADNRDTRLAGSIVSSRGLQPGTLVAEVIATFAQLVNLASEALVLLRFRLCGRGGRRALTPRYNRIRSKVHERQVHLSTGTLRRRNWLAGSAYSSEESDGETVG
jgi:hypothetical protein